MAWAGPKPWIVTISNLRRGGKSWQHARIYWTGPDVLAQYASYAATLPQTRVSFPIVGSPLTGRLIAMARNQRLPDSKALLSGLLSQESARFGVRLLYNPVEKVWRLKDFGGLSTYKTRNDAIRDFFKTYGRKYGHYTMMKQTAPRGVGLRWVLNDKTGTQVDRWVIRPKRDQIAAAIKRARREDSRPSYTRPTTLGWRTWEWNTLKRCLMSPAQHTLWPEPEHRVESWTAEGAVRGHAGVHACRLPRGDWRRARKPHDMPGAPIVGLIERYGKFVLGTEGWRAEWVIIKELLCADEVLAAAVKAAYPEIPVTVAKPDHWSRGF